MNTQHRIHLGPTNPQDGVGHVGSCGKRHRLPGVFGAATGSTSRWRQGH
jgi:hypothetical protein